jgi:hypothetical protein
MYDCWMLLRGYVTMLNSWLAFCPGLVACFLSPLGLQLGYRARCLGVDFFYSDTYFLVLRMLVLMQYIITSTLAASGVMSYSLFYDIDVLVLGCMKAVHMIFYAHKNMPCYYCLAYAYQHASSLIVATMSICNI